MKTKINYIKALCLTIPFVWLLTFFIIPLLVILTFSFFQRGPYGNIIATFEITNYKEVFKNLYLSAFVRTLLISVLNVVLCIFLAYPFSYVLAFYTSPKKRNFLLLAILLPLLSNYLARTYAWFSILGDEGVLNNALLSSGLINKPITLLFDSSGIVLGLLYNYLPFMILSIFVSLYKTDKIYMQAARDLGANSLITFLKVTLPLSIAGIRNGSILVFIFSMSDYVIPNILGGSKLLLISNIITNQFISSRNIPLGAALASVLCVVVVIFIFICLKTTKRYE